MSENRFFTILGVFAAVITLIAFYLHHISSIKPYMAMSMTYIFVLIILNIFYFYKAKILSNASDDQGYIRLTISNLMVKFFITIGIAVGFYIYYNKPRGTFIFPYLFIYLAFTIFETWMLNKQAIMRK
jgi:hypothetical protein